MDRKQILLEIGRDPALAHEVIFSERHTDATPPAHLAMIRDWHSEHPRVLSMAFREFAKSTRAEEAIILRAASGQETNIVILGDNEQRAMDRVRAIKFEFENNETLQLLYGITPGAMWGDKKIVLSNGVIIQGYGRGQSLRGIKYLNARPSLIFCDDLEDEDSVATPASREKTRLWFLKTVLGALDKQRGKVRMAATPLDPDALAPRLAKDAGWKLGRFPIESLSPTGERIPTWPDKFPLSIIDAIKDEHVRQGDLTGFMQEYMCEAIDPATRVFLPDHFKTRPSSPSWHATYAVYDPARTVKTTSATTGKVVFSWIGSRLVIWQADAQKWLPNEIVEDIFSVNEAYHPVLIGIEETGLNEWLMQPLRTEQLRRSTLIPMRALNAPRGKLDFIRSLQPFFKAGQVEFADDGPGMRLLKAQLTAFPTGDIDAPNALAYALTLQPQQPVYDAFNGDVHIADDLSAVSAPAWLAVNATTLITTAILCQVQQGVIRVLGDWMREGDPGVSLPGIVKEARLEMQSPAHRLPARNQPPPNLRLVAPPTHWGEYDNIGLRAVAGRMASELNRGGDPMQGREELREAMTHSVHGSPAFLVSSNAGWTLRALTGGYAYRQKKSEMSLVEGPYTVLMAGLETFTGLLRNQETVDKDQNYSYTAQGRKYLSALAR